MTRCRSVLRAVLVVAICAGMDALASDLTIPVAGRVSVELLSSDAFFHNTISLVSPAGAVIASSGCKLEPSTGLSGQKLMSEKIAVHGCRVDLDSDGTTPGIQGFAAGTVLQFNMCAQTNADPACDFVWSSDPAGNSDGIDHVTTTALRPTEFPGQIFQMGWEDKPDNVSDHDFNDLISVVRVNIDKDGDGLWDDWEQFGADTNGDGAVDLDLPGLGANPNHKDIFVEIDFMDCAVSGSDCASGDTHSHRPKTAAINAAVQAFANAPVTNPDGVNGIALHLNVGNSISHQNALNIPGLCFAGGSGIGNFDTIKADPANFGPDNPRRFAYHYNLWTHQQVTTSTSSGCAELPGNDFQVSLGGWNASGATDRDGDGLSDRDVGTVQQQAGTLIHEMGHNLNLGHGGFDGTNFKPNYLSLMSYFFQTAGIPPTDPDGMGPMVGRLLLSSGTLAPLNETNLGEPAGINAGTNNTFYFCPNGTQVAGSGSLAIDWNCDGDATDTGVTNDINNDRACIGPGPNGTLNTTAAGDDVVSGANINDGPNRTCNTSASGDDQQFRTVGNAQVNPLADNNDWTGIKYDLQSTGAYEDGTHDSAQVVELEYETFVARVMADLNVTKVGLPALVTTGSDITYTIGVKNVRPEGAREVTLTDALPTGTSFVSCLASGGGTCGGSANNRFVTWQHIGGGTEETATLVAKASCALPSGINIENTAAASVATADDPTPLDNLSAFSVSTFNPPPVISAVSASPTTLWPPDHKFVAVTVGYNVTDNCGGTVCSLNVSSNEPVNGQGDGDMAPDWQVVDAHHVRLRAERAGGGSGRVYTIPITCTDSGGASSTIATTVTVSK